MIEPLETRRIEMSNGSRQAVATVGRYENGWTLLRIEEDGYPDVKDSDSLFNTFEEMELAARTIWIR